MLYSQLLQPQRNHLFSCFNPSMDGAKEYADMPHGDHRGVPSNLDFPVVGIGASAGGLDALLRFFEHLPHRNGMAFVVVLHLSPKHESNLDAILQRSTKMQVVRVTETTRIESEHVYVIPPDRHLLMNDGSLTVVPPDRPRGRHVAIDLFFRALAEARLNRAIGIVLSGTGSDGAAGLARLKEQGGVTLVQNPGDAEYDGMPLAAIRTGIVDFVLPVAEIPQKLFELHNNLRVNRLPPFDQDSDAAPPPVTVAPSEAAEKVLQEIIAILRERTGHDFQHYKRATVLRRIERRMQVRVAPDLAAYHQILLADEQESKALLKDMLIGVTHFFRDREAFEALDREVMPKLFENRKPGDEIRIWVAGCATGEEAYSVAIEADEYSRSLPAPYKVQVFATDIEEHAIRVARNGLYPASIVTDVPTPRLRQFFTREEEQYRVRKSVRDTVIFAAHNLLRDPPFTKLDLITCRNLLIYLNRDVQGHLLEMFHAALNSGGFLFLGSAESADALPDLFSPYDKRNRIYQARMLSRSARRSLSLPLTKAERVLRASDKEGEERQARRRSFSCGEVHQRALAEYAPPSVIVNRESDIVHMSEHAGRFLRHPGGEPSRNLNALVLPELRVELRTAIFQAWQSGKSVEARRVQLLRDGRSFYVNMVVRPFTDKEAAADFLLVVFDEVEQTMGETVPPWGTDKKDAVLLQLEEELRRTRERLQEMIEQAEVSTEELKASNEELQAINEELRSASEELETSREELQSINEELVTVNHELKVKVEETGKINDDLNNLIASTDIATIFVDSGMRIKRYTPRAADIFSIIPSDVGRSLLDITHRLDYDRLADDCSTTIETLRLIEREVRGDGGRSYIARLLPYRTTEDRIDGAVLTFFDITILRKAEEKVRAGERHMRLVAESTREHVIITMDNDGLVTSWNKGAERIFGYSEEEMLGQPVDRIFTPEDREISAPEGERRGAREDGRAEDERWHLRKDGTRVYCSGVTTPLRNGEFLGYVKIAREQTERKIGEDQREAQLSDEQMRRKEAQNANTLKDEFLAIMSHELRHPLNLIQVNAELISRMPELRDSKLGTRAVKLIKSSVESQARIIEDLLDLSRLNTGKLTLKFGQTDLAAVTCSIAEIVQENDSEPGHVVEVQGTEQPLLIYADLIRVEQVLLNLLSNALKFTPAGGKITIRVTAEESVARLDVIDTGQGIDLGLLPHVFDMFEQGASVTTRSKGGLGIGLALVRQIAELHGGRVEADSAGPGKGARFSVWFPLCGARGAAGGTGTRCRDSIAGLRVLLVDDMEDAVEALQVLFEMEGATVYAATSAMGALEILQEQTVDLVVSDISMPEMDGYELVRRIRQDRRHREVPVIAATGLGAPKDVELAAEAGFSAHLCKPLSLDAVMHIAAQLCPLRKTEG